MRPDFPLGARVEDTVTKRIGIVVRNAVDSATIQLPDGREENHRKQNLLESFEVNDPVKNKYESDGVPREPCPVGTRFSLDEMVCDKERAHGRRVPREPCPVGARFSLSLDETLCDVTCRRPAGPKGALSGRRTLDVCVCVN